MNKIIAHNIVTRLKLKLIEEAKHLEIIYDVLRCYNYTADVDNDEVACAIRNTENENYAIVFKSGMILFIAALKDLNNEDSEIRRFTGHSFDGLLALLNREFVSDDYDEKIKHLSS